MKKSNKVNIKLIYSAFFSSLITACSAGYDNKPITQAEGIQANEILSSRQLTKTQPHEEHEARAINPAVTMPLAEKRKHIPDQHKTLSRQKLENAKRARQSERLMQYTASPVYQTTGLQTQGFASIQDNEKYAHYENNRVIQTSNETVSTFSIDVDTGSYSNIRRLINSGNLPVKDAIRAEEMINYFNYQISSEKLNNQPFSIDTEIGPSPWSSDRYLLKIGIQADDIQQDKLPASNLVFLLDVSGSMQSANKLGLLKKSLSLLISKLRKQDKIAIVVYAGASGVVLEPTTGDNKQKILSALNSLRAGGSTNGGAGIRLAYQLAQSAFIENGINRILLATDGDFNVGTINFEQLINLVENKRKHGVSLSTIGFGTGNYNDHLMEQLADAANGKYSYIDNLNEAQKVLVDEMSSTLKTVAKDGKIQVEFNPATVSEYRLIGYENRKLNKEDFNNDKVDAGDIGAGDSVTALYEISLHDQSTTQIDKKRYQSTDRTNDSNSLNNELAFVKIRYKNPSESKSRLIKHIVKKDQLQSSLETTSNDFRFSASVAGFAELLKGGQYQQNFNFTNLIELSTQAKGQDHFGYRNEFIQLVRLSQTLTAARNQ